MKREGNWIWIINHYASHLESRHLELAKVFAESGYRVAVITSSFHHGKREYLYDEPVKIVDRAENVRYVYLHSAPVYRTNGAKRVLNMLDFCRCFNREESRIAAETGAPSFVIASSAHPFVWETGYRCAKKFKAKFVAEFRDIWPRSLVEVQGLSPGHPLVKLFGVVEKRAYRRADAVVSTMPFAWKHVCQVAGVPREKVFWMPNGINTEEIDRWSAEEIQLPEELQTYLDEHWCCVYEGSIAKCEYVDFLVEAFRYVKNPQIHLAIIGDGGEKENLRSLVSEYGLENVRLFPEVSKKQVCGALSKAGCCVATIHDIPIYQYGISMNKLSDYLYSGKPTVFACGVDNVVREAGHFALPYGEPQRMAETIEAVYRLPEDSLAELADKGRRLIREEYDYRVIGQRYLNMLEAL